MSVRLRDAQPTDAGTLGAILTEAVTETPWLPRLHTAAQEVGFVGQMIDRGWVTVAEDAATARRIGFLARREHEIVSLFVARAHRGRGVGRLLLAQARAGRSTLTLWTFAANVRAQRFYRREGFEVLCRTDGRNNDENMPDVQFGWRAPLPARPQRTAP